METFRGAGRLRTPDGNELIANINYRVWWQPETRSTTESWSGEIMVDQDVETHGEYIIELENGRKGRCFLSTSFKSMLGLGAGYHYNLRGVGSLK